MKKFDARKIKKLAPVDRYGELYYYWREAEVMIASNFPQARRYGRRLKRRTEQLYSQWFGPDGHLAYTLQPDAWAAG
ncbi:MAG TPA: hypothetical protein VHH88_01280 [Verrucomicrobiae bacterium]|nr:hypothetical protein [Verrucomicrobiae bacterium]